MCIVINFVFNKCTCTYVLVIVCVGRDYMIIMINTGTHTNMYMYIYIMLTHQVSYYSIFVCACTNIIPLWVVYYVIGWEFPFYKGKE